MIRPIHRSRSIEPMASLALKFARRLATSLVTKPAPATLLELHARKQGKVSDKWAAYFPVYERWLTPLRDRPISILEIGIQNGGSLETWAAFFTHASPIVGCDINPLCGQLVYADARIQVVVGDAKSIQTAAAISGICPAFDVIIDDGSHLSNDVIQNFVAYFGRLEPGGLYFVEDTHTLFWADYGGGLARADGAQEFFKKMADIVNAQHWPAGSDAAAQFAAFAIPAALIQDLNAGWLESIEFSDSMIVMRKAVSPGSARVGQRLVCGDEASVDARPLSLAKRLDAEHGVR